MNIKKIVMGISAGAVIFSASAVSAFASTIYDNIPNPVPSNVPSVGFEATSTSEFGNQIGFVGTDRYNPTVTVLMSSWGCESGAWYTGDCSTTPGATFSHPITLNVYEVASGDSVGSLLATTTQTFDMPYRPSSDNANCTGGRWYDGATCFNGKAFTIIFNLPGVTLPDKVIVSVAYNTSDYGASPLRPQACNSTPQGCPYDSLNVGTSPAPSIGTALPTVDDAYLSSTWSGAYCDGSLGTGTFRLDADCWTGFLPSIRVEAQPTPIGPPTDKDQCKNNGWMTFNNPAFKNQGDCVSYVTSNPNASGNKNK